MTKDNLKSAFSGESHAHMKYLLFADKAEEGGFKRF
jgi:rubrerythrin